MKKVLLLVLLAFVFSTSNIFSQEELPCENAINYGNVNDPDKFGSIEPGAYAWYYITIAEAVENVVFSTCSEYTEFDTELSIFSGCEENMNLLWEGYDECDDYKSEIFVERLEPGTYYIMIFGYDEYEYGNYSLSIFNYASSDANTCETAVDYGAVNDPYVSGVILPEEEAWFYINIPNDMQMVLFSTYNAEVEFDTQMEIWMSCDDGGYWKYNDDALDHPTYASEIYVEDLLAGTYYIKIYGYSDRFGSFTFRITDELPEYSCLNAVEYGNMNGPALTYQSMENSISWHKITTTEDYSNVLFSTCDATDLECELFITTDCTDEDGALGWAETGINCLSPEFFAAHLPADTYYIGIFKYDDNSEGGFSLRITSDNTVTNRLVSHYPEEDEINVDIYTTIMLYFAIPVSENDFSNIKILYGDNQEVDGLNTSISAWDENVIQITHPSFLYNTEYTVVIPALSITDYNEEIRWSFKTMPDPNVLSVLELYPEEGEQNVELNTEISVLFNMYIYEDTNIGNITIKDEENISVSGVSAEIIDNRLIIAHDNLSYSKTYTVTIPTGAIEGYDEEITWSFTTKNDPATIEIISRTPGIDATNVALNAVVSVTFNGNITGIASELNNVKITYGEGNTELTGVVATVNGTELKVAHDLFSYDTEYTVIIPTGAIEGYNEENDYITWKFTTLNDVFVSESETKEVNIYPNPSTGLINIEVSENSYIKVIDVTGKVQDTKLVDAGSVSSFTLSSGIYFIQIKTDKKYSTHKVIISE